MYRIAILPGAKKDILEAYKWYEDQRESLGGKFERKIIVDIDKLQSDFVQHEPVYKGLSRVFMKGFPYQIYFKKDESGKVIVIHAVLHNKQSRIILNKRV